MCPKVGAKGCTMPSPGAHAIAGRPGIVKGASVSLPAGATTRMTARLRQLARRREPTPRGATKRGAPARALPLHSGCSRIFGAYAYTRSRAGMHSQGRSEESWASVWGYPVYSRHSIKVPLGDGRPREGDGPGHRHAQRKRGRDGLTGASSLLG